MTEGPRALLRTPQCRRRGLREPAPVAEPGKVWTLTYPTREDCVLCSELPSGPVLWLCEDPHFKII